MQVLYLCFVFLYKYFLLGTYFKMLVKHMTLFTWMHSSAVNVGADVGTEEPMSHIHGCSLLFEARGFLHQITAGAHAALCTYFFLLWLTHTGMHPHTCVRVHAYTHTHTYTHTLPYDLREKNKKKRISHKAQELKVRE